MKKFISIVFLLLVTGLSFAQVSVGESVLFPDARLKSRAWKPQIFFAIVNDVPLMGIIEHSLETYSCFDSDSRILFRFADGTVSKMPIYKDFDVKEKFSIVTIGDSSIGKYTTYSLYVIDKHTLDKIITGDTAIIKIRMVFANGLVNDYVIAHGYQSKLLKGLRYSIAEAFYQCNRSKTDNKDDDF